MVYDKGLTFCSEYSGDSWAEFSFALWLSESLVVWIRGFSAHMDVHLLEVMFLPTLP